MTTIKHKLFWTYSSEDNEVTYWKEIWLPFALNVDYTLSVMGCSPVRISGIDIDLEKDGLVDVDLEEWTIGETQEEWNNLHARFEADGWIYLHGIGLGIRPTHTSNADSTPRAEPHSRS